MSSDDIVISRFNFDQLLISSIDTLKATAIEKCLLADQSLLDIYTQLESFEIKKIDFTIPISTIENAMEQNKEWVTVFLAKKNRAI
jgi:hypothetical protein